MLSEFLTGHLFLMSIKGSAIKIHDFIVEQLVPISEEMIGIGEVLDAHFIEDQEPPRETLDAMTANLDQAESQCKYIMANYHQLLKDLNRAMVPPDERPEEEEQGMENEPVRVMRALVNHVLDVIKIMTTRGADQDIVAALSDFADSMAGLLT